MRKKVFTSSQKASVALSALKGDKTVNQIASLYSVSPICINRWKKEVLQKLPSLFGDKRKKENYTQDRIISDLYRTIGQRDMELEWLKKKLEPFDPSG